MCLVRKACAQRYFAEAFRTGHHQMAGSFQTPSHHVGMWRLANRQFELTRKMRRASTRDRTEIRVVNGAVQVTVNVSAHAKYLPRRQTSPCGAVNARTALDLRLQDARRCHQRRLGRLLIMPQLSPCSFE